MEKEKQTYKESETLDANELMSFEIKPESTFNVKKDEEYFKLSNQKYLLKTKLKELRTSAPTNEPSDFFGQFALSKESGEYYLYIFFKEDKVWKKIALGGVDDTFTTGGGHTATVKGGAIVDIT